MPQKYNEITLNSKTYKIEGQVMPRLASVLPGKVVIGDYTKDSEVVASSWVINDLRGGMLVEEMDEATDQQRCWWTTCDIRFKNGVVLPPLATQLALPSVVTISNGNFESWTAGSPDSWNVTGLPTNPPGKVFEQDTVDYDEGTSSCHFSLDTGYAGSSAPLTITQTLVGSGLWRMTGRYKYYAIGGGSNTTVISASGGDSASLTKDNTWHDFTLSGTGAETITIGISAIAAPRIVHLRVDNIQITGPGAPSCFCDFNDNLYIGAGYYLLKVDDTTGAISVVYMNETYSITDLVNNDDGEMYIWLGDSAAPVKMDTAESVTATGWTSGTYAKLMNGTLYNIDTDDGEFRGDNAALASLNPVVYGNIQGLDVYRDADQATTLYARTDRGLYAYDVTGDMWLQTELSLPQSTNTSKSAVVWQDAYYMSSGLDIIKYIVSSTSTVQNIGLNKDDGIPAAYDGEVAGMVKGYNSIYALVDSSQGGGAGTSWLAEYTGSGWQAIWTDPDGTAKAMTGAGIESSVYARRLWFECNGKLYYMPRQTSLLNPKKLTTPAFATAGSFYTGWFDASMFWKKKAVRLKVYATDVDTSETITISYRTNHSQNDLSTGWTTLVALNTTAESDTVVSTNFGSGAGVSFDAIQFKVTFARDAADSTKSPRLIWMSLVYTNTLPTAWGWQCLIDMTAPYDGRSVEQMWQDLEDVAESETLVPLTFVNNDGGPETHYVEIKAISGQVATGYRREGKYSVAMVAP